MWLLDCENNNMSKKSVLKGIVEKAEGVIKSQKDADVALKAVIGAIVEAVANGEDVRTEAGTFKKKLKKGRHINARTMIHPVTKKEIVIEEQDTEDKTVLVLKSKVVF